MTAALVIILFAIIGAPLFSLVAAAAMAGFHSSGIDLTVIGVDIYRVAEMPVLTAIPLFTFAGYLLGESNAPKRLVRLTDALIGWIPGGLAFIALLACAFFTAFTGASGVTIVAMGALLYPALIEAGYGEKFTLGLVTTTGSLGLLFAPSLPLILYAVVAQQMEAGKAVSIEKLFAAGATPGLLMIALIGGYSLIMNRKTAKPVSVLSARKALSALRESVWEIPLPLAVLGGIYGGIIAVSEAAAVTAVYVFLVEVVILREIKWRDLPEIMSKSMLMVGGILVILAVSLSFTNFMIDAEIPDHLFNWVRGRVTSGTSFLVYLNIMLIALGMMLDIFSALVLVVPLIIPVAVSYGVDPVHLGIVFLANMQIGYLTPPVGLNLFIAAYRFEKSVFEVARACLPFIALLVISVILITYWPGLSLWAIR